MKRVRKAVVPVAGLVNRFDCGTSDGYLEAILHSARSIGKL